VLRLLTTRDYHLDYAWVWGNHKQVDISHLRPSTGTATKRKLRYLAPWQGDNPTPAHDNVLACPQSNSITRRRNDYSKDQSNLFLDWLRLSWCWGAAGKNIGVMGDTRGIVLDCCCGARNRGCRHLHLLLLRLLPAKGFVVRRVMSLLKEEWRGLIALAVI